MHSEPVKTNIGAGLSRRALLAAGALSAVAPRLLAEDPKLPSSRAAGAAPPWWISDHSERSPVVEVRSTRVVHGSSVDSFALREMLHVGLTELAGQASPQLAWRSILKGARRIAIKFNSVGAGLLPGNDTLARLLVRELVDAGIEASDLTLIEISSHVASELGTAPTSEGWSGEVDLGGTRVGLASFVAAADAVINVPLLKTHQIAALSCCCKNIAFGSIRSPARFHAGGCAAAADFVVAPAISHKLRLHIVNAMQVAYAGGPDVLAENTVSTGALLLGFDPIAVDSIALNLLVAERRRLGIDAVPAVPMLERAAELEAGRTRLHHIDHRVLKHT